MVDGGRRDAAALACCCVDAAAAAPACKWRNAVRVGPGGAVLEPASGAFDVVVAVGESVQAAVDRCPRGGSVLLLPGTHFGPLVLSADQSVHVFGRGRARLVTSVSDVVTSAAASATIDGLALKRRDVEGEGEGGPDFGVRIIENRLRVQFCFIHGAPNSGVHVSNGADPVVSNCW